MNEEIIKQMEEINKQRENGEITSRKATKLKMDLLGIDIFEKKTTEEIQGCST